MAKLLCYNFKNGFDKDDFIVTKGANGKVCHDKKFGLKITSERYCYPRKCGLQAYNEHDQWLAYFKKKFQVKRDHSITLNANFSARQLFCAEPIDPCFDERIQNLKDDPRIASSGVRLYDPDNHVVYGYLFTDQGVYAYYERQPWGRKEWKQCCNACLLTDSCSPPSVDSTTNPCSGSKCVKPKVSSSSCSSSSSSSSCDKCSSSSSSSCKKCSSSSSSSSCSSSSSSSCDKCSSSSSSSCNDCYKPVGDCQSVSKSYTRWRCKLKLKEWYKYYAFLQWQIYALANSIKIKNCKAFRCWYKTWKKTNQPCNLIGTFDLWKQSTSIADYQSWCAWNKWKKCCGQYYGKIVTDCSTECQECSSSSSGSCDKCSSSSSSSCNKCSSSSSSSSCNKCSSSSSSSSSCNKCKKCSSSSSSSCSSSSSSSCKKCSSSSSSCSDCKSYDKDLKCIEYASFISMKKVLERGDCKPECAYLSVEITIQADGCVIWRICDREVFQVLNPGYNVAEEYRVLNLGGAPRKIRTKRVVVGFGNHSYLDGAIVNNNGHSKYTKTFSHLTQLLEPHHYLTEGYLKNGSQRSADCIPKFFASQDAERGYFGQGSELKLRWLELTTSRKRDQDDEQWSSDNSK